MNRQSEPEYVLWWRRHIREWYAADPAIMEGNLRVFEDAAIEARGNKLFVVNLNSPVLREIARGWGHGSDAPPLPFETYTVEEPKREPVAYTTRRA